MSLIYQTQMVVMVGPMGPKFILSSRIRKGIIKPHKYVISVLQSITLSIAMQQGKARSEGQRGREKGAKERKVMKE